MALTRDFRETVMARAQRDGAFRREMLKSGVEMILSDDEEDAAIGREQLRDYINATIGFQELARLINKGPKSLMHMFSDRGNPRTSNLAAVLSQLQAHEGVEIAVTLRRLKGG
ncbi:MAG: transcriptional regulator [Myxococcota bacterium]